MEMVVPDEIRAVMRSFPVDADLLLDLWSFIDQIIPVEYPLLRTNRPLDFMHEGFFVAHTFWRGNTSHTFSMWVDDSSATDHLFLRDIQHVSIDYDDV